jgi:isoamylase
MIVDSLRYWVETMHVDGFRFDLASILARDASGHPLPNPPVLWNIESDPVLAGTKLIAEACDAAGLYQVGSFIGDSWKEWNGRFRDDVRDFFRGAPGAVARVADRLVGSPQIYGHEQREAEQSVNFVTCHDGFTLDDLVSYERKRNEANGEDNRDGTDDNRSWNCGVEGPTGDPEIERLRNRQVKNFLTVTVLSLGVPMLLMGDEVRRTQAGNNNAYCQDNAISWFDWTLVEQHADVHRFVTLLNARRLLRSIEHERQRLTLEQLIRQASKAVLVLVLAGATDLAQNVEGPVGQHLHAHQVMAPSRRRAAIVCSRPRVVRPPACISRRAAARLRATQTSGGRLGRRCRASPRNLAEVRETLESDLGSAQ